MEWNGTNGLKEWNGRNYMKAMEQTEWNEEYGTEWNERMEYNEGIK